MPDTTFALPYCTAISGEGENEKKSLEPQPFEKEKDKKSSYLFQDQLEKISKPAQLDIDVRVKDANSIEKHVFFLGGFQLIANSKNVEVYLTDQKGNESYQTTSKGIPQGKGDNGEEWCKAICVIPGGPRPILRLSIKLLSLKPLGSTIAKVKFIKLTARIPELPQIAQPLKAKLGETSDVQLGGTDTHLLPTFGGDTHFPRAQTRVDTNQGGITSADLGAAMATLSITARNTEASIVQSMSEKFQQLETVMNRRFDAFEQHVGALTSVVLSQKKSLEEQGNLLQRQNDTIQTQTEYIEILMKNQREQMKQFETFYLDRLSLNGQASPASIANVQNQIGRSKIPNTIQDDEPIERGIEQTLSNIEMKEEETFSSDDIVGNSTSKHDGIRTPESIEDATQTPMTRHFESKQDDTEKIEVSLSLDECEALQGRVHENGQESSMSPQNMLNMKLVARSFEDRNDKDETKEPDSDEATKVELEVLAIDEDKSVEVLESITADENQRSPPDLEDANQDGT